MTVSRPSRVGKNEQLQARGRVTVELPNVPFDNGSGFTKASQVLSGLSASFGQIADQAAARDGAQAGKMAALDAQISGGQQVGADATPVQAGAFSAPVNQAIAMAAQKHGVDEAALRRIAQIESSGNPNAKNPRSSAAGLFQFISSTAKAYGLSDPYNPAAAADAAARLARDNSGAFQKAFGRAPNAGELYLMHQQGAGGALRLLQDPSQLAINVVGKAAVKLNGGSETMTAGEFANIWMAKAGGGRALTPSQVTPSQTPAGALPTNNSPFNAPLDLAQAGTIRGDAYNDAYRSTYGWRLDTEIKGNLATIYSTFKDDPAALKTALDQEKNELLGSEAGQDPDLREAMQKRFDTLSQGYQLAAQADADQRLRQQLAVDYGDDLIAAQTDIMRRATMHDGSPEAEAALLQEMDRFDALGADAVAAGALTPAQARKASDALRFDYASTRAVAQMDALPTVAQKTAFAEELMRAYVAGQGPLKDLPFEAAKSLVDNLRRSASQLTMEQKTAAKLAEKQMLRRLEDDVASLQTTGQGLEGLEFDTVAATLGMEAALEWQEGRAQARVVHDTVRDFTTLPANEIAARLAELKPEAGTEGYAQDYATWQALNKAGQEIITERQKDPAQAADRAFPQLAELKAGFDPANPDSVAALAQGRLDAQEDLGIALKDRQVFTAQEARSIGDAMRADPRAAAGFAVSLTQALGKDAALAVDQLADGSPSLAEAARIIVEGGSSEALEHMARLQTLESTDGWKAPKLDTRQAATLASTAYGQAFSATPAREQALRQGAMRIFQSMAIDAGIEPDLKSDDGKELYEKALQISAGATYRSGKRYGGIDEVNGRKVRIPPDMREGRLETMIAGLNDETLAALPPMVSNNGLPITARQLRDAELIPLEDGRFVVALPNRYGGSPRLVAAEPESEGAYFDATMGAWLWALDAGALEQAFSASDTLDNDFYTQMMVAP